MVMDLYQDVIKPYALDEVFGELMDQSVGAMEQKSFSGQREVRATSRTQQRRWSLVPDLGSRASRLLLLYLGQFCMVDLHGGRSIGGHEHHRRARPPLSNESDQLSKQAHVTRWPWWPRAIRCIYFYCIIKGLVTLYYQYSYDFNLVRHERLRAYLTGGGADNSRAPKFYAATAMKLPGGLAPKSEFTQHQLEQYENGLAHAKWMLRLLGAPYMSIRFGIECSYIFFLLVSLGLYIQTQLFFTYVHPFDFALVRSIIDFKRELSLCNKLIRWQLNKFLESSRMFTCIVVTDQPTHECRATICCLGNVPERSTHDGGGGWDGCAVAEVSCIDQRHHHLLRSDDAKIRRALENHSRTIEQIQQMALNGALMPANKQHDWVRQLANANCFYTTIYLSYCTFIGLVLVLVLPSHLQARLGTEPMDLVTALELLLVVIVVNLSSTFWASIVLLTSLDQVHLVRELKFKFDQTLRVNISRFQAALLVQATCETVFVAKDQQMALAANLSPNRANGTGLASRPWTAAPGWARSPGGSRSHESKQVAAITSPNGALHSKKSNPIQAQMDADLLELLLSYKIFVAQLEPLKRSYGFVTLTTCTLIILMPVIGRVHMPYVDGRIKLYVGALSLLCTVACDLLILIPVAYLYTRCIELHKSLSSVLAHTVEVSHTVTAAALANGDRRRHCRAAIIGYNEHTVFALAKELRYPERLVDQFATTVLGVRLTYSNLLKIHFWIGFITQSFLFESSLAANLGEVPGDLFGSIFADPLGLR